MFIIVPYKMRLLRLISHRIGNYKKRTISSFEILWESVFKGGMLALTVATIVWISIFLYVVFYWLYMPALSHTRLINLQFVSCETEKGVCSFPSAHVQLTKKQQLLMIGQSYKIVLNLEMPESPANVDLGMFMVCARMVDKSGVLVSNSCRSTMLHYRSLFLKFLMVCVNSPFLIFGSSEEKQTLLIELYSDFEEHQGHPVTDIYVEVQSRYVELYSATMNIQARLTGLRYLMFHWPILSAVLGVSSNLFVLAFIFSLSWYHLYLQNEHGRPLFLDSVKKLLSGKILEHNIVGNEDYIEELSRELAISEKAMESSSESDESKSEMFKPGTSEELGFYLDGGD